MKSRIAHFKVASFMIVAVCVAESATNLLPAESGSRVVDGKLTTLEAICFGVSDRSLSLGYTCILDCYVCRIAAMP